MSRYQAVLFDFDGVLVDSEPVHWECWQEILKPFGVNLDWQTYSEHCIGVADRAMLAFLCSQVDPPLDIDVLLPEYPRKKAMFRERMVKPEAVAPDVIALIDRLRHEYKLGLVTSSGRSEVEPILQAAGVRDHFDTVVYGGDVARLKPAPDPYLLAMQRLGVKRGIAIEDSCAGITAAKAAGLEVIEVSKQCEMCGLVCSGLELEQAPKSVAQSEPR